MRWLEMVNQIAIIEQNVIPKEDKMLMKIAGALLFLLVLFFI
jgi:hypothetical protein